MWLHKFLKLNVSEDASKRNIINGQNHCCNLDDSTFTIFIDNFEGNWVGKSFFCCYAKYSNCLLTYWLPMTRYSVLNRDNLREPIQITLCLKERKFSPFSSAFLKYTVNSEDFFKKDDPHGRCISEVGDSEIRD